MHVYIFLLGQKKINAYNTTATAANVDLSSGEFIATTWATNALVDKLIDDVMFRKHDPAPDTISYWFEMAVHVPLLSKVAVAVCSIAPSEACVERSFSNQGLVHSDHRSSLEDSSVQAIMQVRMNIHHVYIAVDQPAEKKAKTE